LADELNARILINHCGWIVGGTIINDNYLIDVKRLMLAAINRRIQKVCVIIRCDYNCDLWLAGVRCCCDHEAAVIIKSRIVL
jgi:hypothetical protein